MFNSIAAAPESCIDRAYPAQLPGVLPLMLPITGTDDRGGRSFEQAQVPARPVVVVGHLWEVGQRLSEAVRARLGHPCIQLDFVAQLLFEQRIEHHRTDSGVGQAPDTVDGVRQRGRRRDQRVAQSEAKVARRQVHQCFLRASGWKCSGPREAISS